MFVGHLGVALGAKRMEPTVSLGWLLTCAVLADLAWGVLLWVGLERASWFRDASPGIRLRLAHAPYSHSLGAVLAGAVVLALLYLLLVRYPRGARMTAVLVLSHWLLDALVHTPDLLLYPGAPWRVGLGLGGTLPGALGTELLLLIVGLVLYLRSTPAADRIGSYGLWLLLLAQLGVWAVGLFGPRPPSAEALAGTTLVCLFFFILGATWVDRHRWSIIDTELVHLTFADEP